MEGFSNAYALFGTNYGSVDTCFRKKGEGAFTTVPAGIAHYLEHKLFESEDGDAVGDGGELLFPFQPEAVVDRAVIGPEDGVSGAEPFHGVEEDAQAGFMLQPDVLLPHPLAADH